MNNYKIRIEIIKIEVKSLGRNGWWSKMFVSVGLCLVYHLKVLACWCSWTKEHGQDHGDAFQVHKWGINLLNSVVKCGSINWNWISVTLLYYYNDEILLFPTWIVKTCVLCSVVLLLLREVESNLLVDWWNLDIWCDIRPFSIVWFCWNSFSARLYITYCCKFSHASWSNVYSKSLNFTTNYCFLCYSVTHS